MLNNKIENSEITLFEEGTMVNLFFDQETNEWEIVEFNGFPDIRTSWGYLPIIVLP